MAELKQRMSSREFESWKAFARHEPLGGARMDALAAMLANVLVNVNTAAEDRRDLTEEFLPEWWQAPTEPRTAEELYEMMRSWALMSGAKEKAHDDAS